MRAYRISPRHEDQPEPLRQLQFLPSGRGLVGLQGAYGQEPSLFRLDLVRETEHFLADPTHDLDITTLEDERDPQFDREGEIRLETLLNDEGYRGLFLLDTWQKPIAGVWLFVQDPEADEPEPWPLAYSLAEDGSQFWTLRTDEDRWALEAWDTESCLNEEQASEVVRQFLPVRRPIPLRGTLELTVSRDEQRFYFMNGSRAGVLWHRKTGQFEPIDLPPLRRLGAWPRGRLPEPRPRLLPGPNPTAPWWPQPDGLWEWGPSGKIQRVWTTTPQRALLCATCLPGTSRLLISLADGTVGLFNIDKGHFDQTWRFEAGLASGLAAHPNGLMAAAGFLNGEVLLWDLE